MRRQKRETVSVSFHYLTKEIRDEDGKVTFEPFSSDEFAALADRILTLPPLDFTDETVKDRMRFKSMVPLELPEKVDDRTLFGIYRASYWGHAYENTDVGKIPADSLSLRPFFYVLYHSKSGRIYIGTQYLGHYGGYTGLKNTLVRLLPSMTDVTAHSFRIDGLVYEKLHPKEVRITVSKKGATLASDNSFGDRAVIAFRKQGRNDVAFEEDVKTRILPHFGKSKEDVQEAVAKAINSNELIDVNDEDIADCQIIADVNGRTRNIYMIEQGSFASQFYLSVPFDVDGHPERKPTKNAMLHALTENIISRGENV